MPHAELKYSNDVTLDAAQLLADIEATILRHDTGSGACKGRAYPAAMWNHSHIMLDLAMLAKPHRDKAFADGLTAALNAEIKRHLSQKCYISIAVRFMDDTYYTGSFDPNA